MSSPNTIVIDSSEDELSTNGNHVRPKTLHKRKRKISTPTERRNQASRSVTLSPHSSSKDEPPPKKGRRGRNAVSADAISLEEAEESDPGFWAFSELEDDFASSTPPVQSGEGPTSDSESASGDTATAVRASDRMLTEPQVESSPNLISDSDTAADRTRVTAGSCEVSSVEVSPTNQKPVDAARAQTPITLDEQVKTTASSTPTASPEQEPSTTATTRLLTAAELEIDRFCEITKESAEIAQEWLSKTNGSMVAALPLYYSAKYAPRIDTPPQLKSEKPAGPPNLIDEVLHVHGLTPKKRFKDGDTLIILTPDLSKVIRLRSEDAARASTLFRDELSAISLATTSTSDVEGIKHLYILQRPTHGGVPMLARKGLLTMRADCKDEFYTPPYHAGVAINNTEPTTQAGEKIKVEGEQVETHAVHAKNDSSQEHSAPDWVQTYIAFLHVIASPSPQLRVGLDLPKIERVAQLASLYGAVSPSVSVPISAAFASLFQVHIASHNLWKAIAERPDRWLVIGIHLQNALIYDEALKHVIGRYSSDPSSVDLDEIRRKAAVEDVVTTIRTKAKDLRYHRYDIERELTCLTLSGNVTKGITTIPVPVNQNVDPTAYNVVNIFRDWVTSHLSHLHTANPDRATNPDPLCQHPDDKSCLTVAGLHRLIGRGSDAYLPVESLLAEYWNRGLFRIKNDDDANVRTCLKTLKEKAARIVAPLNRSTLQYEGKETLEYLTCFEVDECDRPWKDEVKMEDDEDEDEGGEIC